MLLRSSTKKPLVGICAVLVALYGLQQQRFINSSISFFDNVKYPEGNVAILNAAATMTASENKSTPPPTTTVVRRRQLDSGWNKAGIDYYNNQKRKLVEAKVADRTINLAGIGNVTVSSINIGNHGFWDRVHGRRAWERGTFAIFEKYVTPDTIVVDFGCWIGPTVLFHGQFSKHSYGIEADPVAFATSEYNVNLNRHRRPWGNHVTMESACVSAPQHVGTMTMRGAKAPGASMSGISEKLARRTAGSWEVKCYTLESILQQWGVDLAAQHVMFKVDVESYECKLIPSLYDWLKDQPRLPTMYITFHPEIDDCTPDEWAGVLQTFKLYENVHALGDKIPLSITSTTKLEQFEAIKSEVKWRRDSTFVVSGKRPV